MSAKRGRPAAAWDDRLRELMVHLQSQGRPRDYLAGVMGWTPKMTKSVLRYGKDLGIVRFTHRGPGATWEIVRETTL